MGYNNKGFSLIELCIVILVLIIIMALFTPLVSMGIKAFVFNLERQEILSSARIGMTRLIRFIREANPEYQLQIHTNWFLFRRAGVTWEIGSATISGVNTIYLLNNNVIVAYPLLVNIKCDNNDCNNNSSLEFRYYNYNGNKITAPTGTSPGLDEDGNNPVYRIKVNFTMAAISTQPERNFESQTIIRARQ